MISSDKDVEQIVPLGYLGGALGYSIKWSGGSMTLNHPEKGEVIVKIINGCPQVEKKVALDMIKEIEKGRRIEKAKLDVYYKEKEWLQGLVEAHPILKGLPSWLKCQLPDLPADDLRRIPGCNRRKRKKMRSGLVAHLYAGEKEGYDLGRAFKEVGGDGNKLVEIVMSYEERSGGRELPQHAGGWRCVLISTSCSD